MAPVHYPAPDDAARARLLDHIEAHLDSPALTPQAAAAALGISVRRLHALMGGTPTTFSLWVAQRRLERARTLLREQPATVAEVAFACGFGSLATFYRQYVAAFGAPPVRSAVRRCASPDAWTST